MIDRKELVAVLRKVEPALSAKDLIPVFTNFCFGKDNTIHAYDDVVALRFPAKFGIVGGVRGRLLLDLLEASKAKEVELSQDGLALKVKAGRSKLALSMVPEKDFLFVAPDMENAREISANEKFMSALTRVALSLGKDKSVPWRCGVTVSFSDGGMTFYASDNKTAARVIVGEGGGKRYVRLAPRFVELLLDKSKTDPVVKLTATKEAAEAKFTSGLKLFCKGDLESSLDKFNELFSSADELKSSKAEIPKGFDRCLHRAAVVVQHATQDPYTRMTAGKERLKLVTRSPVGDVTDSIPLDHPDAEALVAPDLVLRALPHVKTLDIHENYLKLAGGGLTYIVGSVLESKETTDAEE